MSTMKKVFAGFGVILMTLMVGISAHATCVVVDQQHDQLGDAERLSAGLILTETLREEGIEVATAPCSDAYVVYHIRLGEKITVVMAHGERRRRAESASVEDLPQLYSQMIRAIISDTPVGNELHAVKRSNVVEAQANPKRIKADSLWYLSLGPILTLGEDVNPGSQFTFGYRYELNSFGVDASISLGAHNINNDESGFIWTVPKLMGLYFFDPESNGTFYLGGGLSWGGVSNIDKNEDFDGSGLQGELALGYELLRTSSLRMFIQANATLPFYRGSEDGGDERYTPTFGIAFGIGL
ncbi:MAG: hypothetical protein R3C68_04775 [Myxococcota bacterium]